MVQKFKLKFWFFFQIRRKISRIAFLGLYILCVLQPASHLLRGEQLSELPKRRQMTYNNSLQFSGTLLRYMW